MGELAKVSVKSVVIRVEELCVIKSIEKLRTEFDGSTLRKLECPPDREVEVVAPGPAKDVSARIAKAKQRHINAIEGGGIEIEIASCDWSSQTIGS